MEWRKAGSSVWNLLKFIAIHTHTQAYGNVRKWLKFMRAIQDERACGFVPTIRGIHDSMRLHAFI